MSTTKVELMEALGAPTLRAFSVEDGRRSELLTWSYAKGEISPAVYVPGSGLFVACNGKPLTGPFRTLTVVFSEGGKMVSRSWLQNRD